MTTTTTVMGISKPQSSDANNVPLHLGAVADFLDVNPSISPLSGAVIAALTGPQKPAGRVVYNTTTGTLQISNGTTFRDVFDANGGAAFVEAAQDAAGALATSGTFTGFSLAYDDANNKFTGSNTDGGAAAVTTHLGVSDPHPQYLLQAEGDALYKGITLGANRLLAINAQTGTTYTPVLADAQETLVTLSNASAIVLTVPTNASVAFPIGSVINLAQIGAGQVTITPAGGVTVSAFVSATKIAGQNAQAFLVKIGTNAWLLAGQVAP